MPSMMTTRGTCSDTAHSENRSGTPPIHGDLHDPFLPKLTRLISGTSVDHANRSDDASARAQALRRVARMRFHTSTFSAAILFALLHGQSAMGSDRFPTTDWERVDPEGAGWSRQKLEKAESWSRQINSIAVMVVHHGLVVAKWGDTAGKTPLASVRKSLLSALIGIAVERKELDLSQTIGSLGIDDNEPSLTPEEKTATVRDLLRSRSGVYHAALYESRGRRPRARLATAINPVRSGTTTIGISIRLARSMSVPCGRPFSMRSSARSPGRSACRTISRGTVNTLRARGRSIRHIQFG